MKLNRGEVIVTIPNAPEIGGEASYPDWLVSIMLPLLPDSHFVVGKLAGLERKVLSNKRGIKITSFSRKRACPFSFA